MLQMASQWKIMKEMHYSIHLGRGAQMLIASQMFGRKDLNNAVRVVTLYPIFSVYRTTLSHHPIPPPLITSMQRRGT